MITGMMADEESIIRIKQVEPFASGGNRLCFKHPQDENRCLKVIRADRTPAIRRAQKSFPANLRPLSSYDENLVEVTVLKYLHDHYPSSIKAHLPETYGLVMTDLGMAHDSELVRDEDGLISQTLEQYVWDNGLDELAVRAIKAFKDDWATAPPRTRDLIPHNMVVQQKGAESRLVLIDGFGKKPMFNLPGQDRLARSRLRRRLADFDARVQLVLERKKNNDGPMHRINNLHRDA